MLRSDERLKFEENFMSLDSFNLYELLDWFIKNAVNTLSRPSNVITALDDIRKYHDAAETYGITIYKWVKMDLQLRDYLDMDEEDFTDTPEKTLWELEFDGNRIFMRSVKFAGNKTYDVIHVRMTRTQYCDVAVAIPHEEHENTERACKIAGDCLSMSEDDFEWETDDLDCDVSYGRGCYDKHDITEDEVFAGETVINEEDFTTLEVE